MTQSPAQLGFVARDDKVGTKRRGVDGGLWEVVTRKKPNSNGRVKVWQKSAKRSVRTRAGGGMYDTSPEPDYQPLERQALPADISMPLVHWNPYKKPTKSILRRPAASPDALDVAIPGKTLRSIKTPRAVYGTYV